MTQVMFQSPQKVVVFPLSVTPGKLQKITPTASPGKLVHAVDMPAGKGYHLVTLKAQNTHTAAVVVTVEIAGVTADDRISVSVPNGAAMTDIMVDVPVMPDQNTVPEIRVYAATADVVKITGIVKQVELG